MINSIRGTPATSIINMHKRKVPTIVQEVTFIPKKKRRGGQKVEVKLVPDSPATPTSSNGRHSNFSTPPPSSHI